MHKRIVPALLCAAAIALACAPRPRAAAQAMQAVSSQTRLSTAAPATTPVRRRSRTVRPASIDATFDVRGGAEVSLALRVTNTGGKHTELRFPSGATHDFVVLDSVGREVWRWSQDRMFTQAVQTRLLDSDESTTYDATWDATGHHGTYTVVATLASDNWPIERRVTITLP